MKYDLADFEMWHMKRVINQMIYVHITHFRERRRLWDNESRRRLNMKLLPSLSVAIFVYVTVLNSSSAFPAQTIVLRFVDLKLHPSLCVPCAISEGRLITVAC